MSGLPPSIVSPRRSLTTAYSRKRPALVTTSFQFFLNLTGGRLRDLRLYVKIFGVFVWSNLCKCERTIRELKQRRRRRRQGRRKKTIVLLAKQLLSTCITFFSTFLWRPLHHYHVKPPNSTFCGGRGHTTTNCPSSIWTWIKLLKIQLQENSPTSDELRGFK